MLVRIFVALLAICATQTAHAAILVTFDSTSIVANQTGFVDVWIESPQSDLLSGFSAYFQLVAPATSNGTLSFAPAADQPNSQTLFGTEYVLSGGTGLVPINYSATPVNSSEILLIDFLNDVKEKPLGTTRWRLARFAVKHTTSNAALAEGDTYEIKMFQKSQDLTEDTAFFDSTHDLDISGRPASPVEPFANSGSIRVTAATAVPEPSGAFTVGLLTAFVGFRRRRQSSRNGCS